MSNVLLWIFLVVPLILGGVVLFVALIEMVATSRY